MPSFSEFAVIAISKYNNYKNRYEISDDIAKLFSKNYSDPKLKIDPKRAPLLCVKYKSVRESLSDKYYLKDIQYLLGIPDWQLRKYVKKGLLSATSIFSEDCSDDKKGKNPGKSKYRVSKDDFLNFISNNQAIIQCTSYFNEMEFEHEGRRYEYLEEIKNYTRIAKNLYKTEKFLEKKDQKKQIEEENLYVQIEAIEVLVNDELLNHSRGTK